MFLIYNRAAVAHQIVSEVTAGLPYSPTDPAILQTNCITEVIFADALVQAQELDREFERTGRLRGPLHGVPVTVKDQFNVKGHDSTIGYVGRSFSPATEDAVLVQILRDMGALIPEKSNIPNIILFFFF
jgi:Asp-tRNA(Asn)/Glu-tRNA(Gln) amidotransferase A subunit family amidase